MVVVVVIIIIIIIYFETRTDKCVGRTLEGTHAESSRNQPLNARGNLSNLTQPLCLLVELTKLK